VANSTRSVIPRLVPSLPIATCHRYQSTSASTTPTSGLSFKKAKRHHRQLPFVQTVQPSAEEAVNNILYNTPGPSSGPETRHILSCLVRNEPGVLSRVSGVLAARGFNIDSLVVANTEVPDLSRMTIIFKGQNTPIEQARRQLEDVVSEFLSGGCCYVFLTMVNMSVCIGTGVGCIGLHKHSIGRERAFACQNLDSWPRNAPQATS
jgi:acetolactate synthase regulatory subunit